MFCADCFTDGLGLWLSEWFWWIVRKISIHQAKEKRLSKSITWGKSERFKFSSVGALVHWSPPTLPAVYAVSYKQDPKNSPKSHTVLFFGQANDLNQQAPAHNQEILDVWAHSGGDINELMVFIHPMPGSTLTDRLNVHERLVAEYRPDYNRY